MDNKQVLKTIQEIRTNSPKRNFSQTFDLIINLKNLDLKKPEQNINTFVTLHHSKGKKIKICGFVDAQLASKAKEVLDTVVLEENFSRYSDKKLMKKLVSSNDVFLAQGNLMGKVATVFGRVLGPKGKMPNPKAGGIITPASNLKMLYDKFQKTVHLQTKNELIVKCSVGKEDMKDEEIVDNVMTIYNSLIHSLPQEKSNIKSVYLKLTMSKSFLVGKEERSVEEDKKGSIKVRKVVKEKKLVKKEIEEDKPKKIKEKALKLGKVKKDA